MFVLRSHLHETEIGVGEELLRETCCEGEIEPLVFVKEVS